MALTVAAYAVSLAVYWAWLNAYDPVKYPAQQADIIFWSMLLLAVLLVGLFIDSLRSLRKFKLRQIKVQ